MRGRAAAALALLMAAFLRLLVPEAVAQEAEETRWYAVDGPASAAAAQGAPPRAADCVTGPLVATAPRSSHSGIFSRSQTA
jgi:hypothetical protein